MRKGWRRSLAAVATTVLIVAVTGCHGNAPKVGGDNYRLPVEDGIYNPYQVPLDPLYEVRSASISAEGKSVPAESYKIPARNIQVADQREKKDPERVEVPAPSKISPVLAEWLAKRDPGEPVDIIVTFQDAVRIPRLPDLGPGEDREKGGSRRAEAIQQLVREREGSQKEALAALAQYARFRPRESFWIVNSVVGSTTLGEVKRLAESPRVVYLQPVRGGEEPPQDGNNNNDAEDARAQIVSDPYFGLAQTTPWIGLLDTGVRDSHQMFNSPDHLAWLRDCVNGGTSCNQTSNPGYDTTDFAWNHGTSSAGILTGNARRGGQFRGVTAISTDSWQVYTAGGLDSAAAVRGFQAAVAAFDKVLVGEIQAVESETGAIATAADNAYDAGAIVVAANGNFGPGASSVRSPGIAHKALGVGAFFTDGGAQYDAQGRGPATDGRFKPDIQTPTRSETASNASDTALREFGGTSGATPYASAAAMLSRNWLHSFGTFDNGQTYAFMILYGQRNWPYDNTVGAGRLEMATSGTAWWGKVVVTNGLNVDIPISIGAGRQGFDVALWWPESAAQTHNDVDVHLLDPSAVERGRGFSAMSVFERAGQAGSLAAGTWTVRIRGYNVPTGAQTVYWAAHVRN